jgi:diguanylate cyclase (GGDEF)-like protein
MRRSFISMIAASMDGLSHHSLGVLMTISALPRPEAVPDRLARSRWVIYLALGLTAIGVYYLLPTAGVAQAVLLTTVNGVAAGCALMTARASHGRARTVWGFLGLSMVLATLANGPYYGFPLVTGRPVPFPCPVDVLWLLTYPCYIVALNATVRQQRREDRRGNALDASILVVSGAVLMWEFVLEPVATAAGIPLLAHVVAFAYPAMDVLVFAMLVRVAIVVSWRNTSLRLLLLSFFALLVGDTIYTLQLSAGTYHFGGVPDGIWMASYLLIGVAAMHLRAGEVANLTPSSGQRLSQGRLAFLCAAVLSGPILLASDPHEVWVATSACILAFLLVMARMTGLNRTLVLTSVELESRASTDSLTALANRAAFHERLAETLAQPERRNSVQAVLFVDIDDFKDVNDNLGHAAGDELLCVVADRLRDVVRPDDLVARLGGDEFALLLNGVPDRAAALSVAERAVAALSQPTVIHGQQVRIGASVGLALRQPASEPDTLMRQSDVAMYTAKGGGKNRVEIYDAALDQALGEHHALKADIIGAAGRGELVLHYQPVVGLNTGHTVGVEALVRWDHPTRGQLPPLSFIGLAEDTGAIIDIGLWVLTEACTQMHAWHLDHARPDLFISVNVSVRQLDRPGFAEDVREVLCQTELDPSRLVIEVTESVLADPFGGAARTLESLREIGVRIAIDDFGTGYSSISYLSRLPVDILKIDRSFVSGATPGPQADAVLESIVDLAMRLGLDIIPEGIEETNQLTRLQTLGCEAGQGFLLSRPLSAAAIDTLLVAAPPIPTQRLAPEPQAARSA